MKRYETTIKNIYIIGGGGVGSWLLPALVKLLEVCENKPALHIVDGDTLEIKNMNRQLFDEAHIGRPKAVALYERYRKDYPHEFIVHHMYLDESFVFEEHSLVFGCVDNHPGRKNILRLCDKFECRAIIGGNEYTDSEAYYYEPSFKDGPQDPRVYYPDLMTSHRGDPTAPVGCTGEVAVDNPQLIWANYSAANHMMGLFWFHWMERPAMDADSKPHWPYLHRNTFSRFSTLAYKDAVMPVKRKPANAQQTTVPA